MSTPNRPRALIVLMALVALTSCGSSGSHRDHAGGRAQCSAIAVTQRVIAGTGAPGYAGDGGPAIAARLNHPGAVAVDGRGNVYIADADNYRVRRVDPSGRITTVAGVGTEGFSGDRGPAIRARISAGAGLAVDHAGDLYLADWANHRVRKVSKDGVITTLAGNGDPVVAGDHGPAVRAGVGQPTDVAVDKAGNVYVSQMFFNVVRRISADGIIDTFAGTGDVAPIGRGDDDVQATAAPFNGPDSLAINSSGLAVLEVLVERVRAIDGTGRPHTLLDPHTTLACSDHPVDRNPFQHVVAMAAGPGDVLYLCDVHFNEVYRYAAHRVQFVAHVAGAFNLTDIAVDPSGRHVYVADDGGDRVFELTLTG